MPDQSISSQNVLILGGGLAGCLSVLALHASFPATRMTLVEHRSCLLSGSSAITPGRMGLGFHYLLDLKTAMMYLEETIGFMRAQLCDDQGCIQDKFIIGQAGSKLRKGHYFFINEPHTIRRCTNQANIILSQLSSRLAGSDTVLRSQAVDQVRNANTDGYALFTRERITTSLDALQRRYGELIANDPRNAMVGPLDGFYRPVNILDYASLINTQLTDMGIETQECLLNWPEYERHVKHKIQALAAKKRLTILTEHDVKDVKSAKVGESSYRVTAVNTNNHTVEMHADALINCTWHNVEWVARSIPSPPTRTPMTSRVKMLCRVSLPPLLIMAPSIFFGVGAHCMFSNLGDGTGLITYAPVTNAFSSQEQQLPAEWLHRLRYGLSNAEQDIYGEAIIEGVSFYIPPMRTCQLLHCAVGVVKSRGRVDIYDSSSSHHAREEHGVECVHPGFVNNAAMKLFYAHSNAYRTVEILAPILSS